MNVTRRRFLTISAAAILIPGVQYDEYRWSGHALGAETSLVFRAPRKTVEAMISSVLKLVDEFEATFSIYRKNSEISTLNQCAHIRPSKLFHELAGTVSELHENTFGYFDPTVQSVWGQNHDLNENQRWRKVKLDHVKIRLPKSTQVSLNGIAQGFLTDIVDAHIRKQGFSKVLINFGEYKGIGGPWNVGLQQPAGMKSIRLNDSAIATSSPYGMIQNNGHSHLINPYGYKPILYKSVSVEHPSATIADALSTAFVFMSHTEIQQVISEHYPESLVHLTSLNKNTCTLRS